MNLSKSKYCNAIQCPKILWLSKYKKEVYDESVLNQAVLEQGSEVGDLAMGLFGDYVEVPFGDLSDMLAETNRLMEDGTEIIAEASFAFNGLFCSVDILKNKGNGHVELYEVKSSSKVHEVYYDDVAYQCYVLKKLGYIVDRSCVVHINTSYVRGKVLELTELFVIADITMETMQKLGEVDSNINWLEAYMKQKEEPEKDISMDCFDPYECGFFKYCTRHLPSPNVFDVARLSKKKKFEYYNKGLVSFKKLYEEKALTKSYLPQVEHEVLGLVANIDVDAIREFMSTLYYPLYFLDFETFSSAIPLYKNSSPYQQIPFQYSLHYIESENAYLQHKEYLAQAGSDPRRELAESLCNDIPENVCVTAYNMGFEKGRIRELAQMYPDLSKHLMNIHDNIVDLMIPFQKKQYYQKEMQGSYSIKYVLPALFPDDPELNYSNLEGVHNGSEASNTFRKMVEMDPEEVVKYREHLLNYCKLDTYAMVKIWHRLNEVIGIKQRRQDMGIKDILNEVNNVKNNFVENVINPTIEEFKENIAVNESDIEKNEYHFGRRPGERFEDKYAECPNCGEVLNKTAKFCDQCGTKLVHGEDSEHIPHINKKPQILNMDVTYGEVMGTEKWDYFGNHNQRILGFYNNFKENRKQQVCYNNHFYYIDKGYVWQSNTDGTSQKVVLNLEDTSSYVFSIFVNSHGIYIKSEQAITLYDFNGKEKAVVKTIDEIKSYYICDDKIYLITRDKNFNDDRAYFYDVTNRRYNTIFEGYYKELGENTRGEKSYKSVEMQCIMANEKRVVMWLDVAEYYYPENEDEELYEIDVAGWYSYDLEEKKMKPINWVDIYPHELATEGAAAFENKLEAMNKYIFGEKAERNDYYKIAFFNMEKDLMWTVKKLGNGEEIWEPRRIGNVTEESVLNNYTLWNIPTKHGAVNSCMYFDGEIRVVKESDYDIFFYGCDGNKSENWGKHPARDTSKDIKILGDYIFVLSDEIRYDCWTQYKIQDMPGEALKVSWMHRYGSFSDEMEKEKDKLIFEYEMTTTEGASFNTFGPVPTKKNYDRANPRIDIIAKKNSKSSWISEELFEVNKRIDLGDEKDEHYDLERETAPLYKFYYWNEYNTRIPYDYLDDIQAYCLYDEGLLFIKDGKLYDLSEKEKKYTYVTNVNGLVHKIDLEGNSIFVEKINGYKQVLTNEEIIDGEFGVIGYKDLYKLDIERVNVGMLRINNNKQNISSCESIMDENVPAKYSYWESFIEYTFSAESTDAFAMAGFTLPKPADRNWYALRLGTAKARIELQINTRNNMIRTALYIKDEVIWNRVETLLASKAFDANKIHVDNESKTPSISLYKPIEGMNINKKEQYDWFIECALVFKQFYDVATK